MIYVTNTWINGTEKIPNSFGENIYAVGIILIYRTGNCSHYNNTKHDSMQSNNTGVIQNICYT